MRLAWCISGMHLSAGAGEQYGPPACRSHRYFECNYGDATIPLDKWFGSFRDGLPNGAGAKLAEEHRD